MTCYVSSGTLNPTHSLIHLALDSMTLIYETDLDILKMYLHTMNEVSMSRVSKVTASDKRDRTHYQPHWRVLTKH